jgi:hypothetical protein
MPHATPGQGRGDNKTTAEISALAGHAGECPEIGGIAGARFVEGQHMSRHFSSDEVAGRAQ